MNNKIERMNLILSNIVLILIGMFSLGYSLFDRRFAELHLGPPFLDFPIFIGEILLFLCLILLIIKLRFQDGLREFNKWHYFLFIYIAFVLIKALWGYFKWGPLAFRHAALFYYPLFAVLGYNFYNRSFFTKRKILFLFSLTVFIIAFINFSEYFLLTYVSLTLVLITAYPGKRAQYALIFLLLFLPHYKSLFFVGRTGLISNLVAIAFLIITIPLILRVRKQHKVMLFSLLAVFTFIGVLKLADSNAVKTLINLKQVLYIYNQYKGYIATKEKDFKMAEIKKIKLYNPEVIPLGVKEDQIKEDRIGEVKAQLSQVQVIPVREVQIKLGEVLIKIKEIKTQIAKTQASPSEKTPAQQVFISVAEKAQAQIEEALTQIKQVQVISMEEALPKIREVLTKIEGAKTQISQMKVIPGEEAGAKVKEALKKTEEAKMLVIEALQYRLKKDRFEGGNKYGLRLLGTMYNNTFFRIFVWEDLLKEIGEKRPLFGFDFGKPFRSKNIEILFIADGEWGRDGWIAVHNSFLEIIYRAGIVGILLIFFVFAILFKLIKKSINTKSLVGILLCGILINWIVAANSLVILELPYNAIPFWSLFGMTFAYLKPAQINTDKIRIS